ncbi:hypothetical protein PAPYR_1817 [Paratrimastix pyriformis]|uniref:Uncharacterized protein n=1 Tax=Paratrimastix pyriformis TaxID=342808 RepID=A0ABQ8UVW0_9EUKA|nr:hypothetical protein PAPYR_1817 [Paratrimastix pyriformis]
MGDIFRFIEERFVDPETKALSPDMAKRFPATVRSPPTSSRLHWWLAGWLAGWLVGGEQIQAFMARAYMMGWWAQGPVVLPEGRLLIGHNLAPLMVGPHPSPVTNTLPEGAGGPTQAQQRASGPIGELVMPTQAVAARFLHTQYLRHTGQALRDPGAMLHQAALLVMALQARPPAPPFRPTLPIFQRGAPMR